MRNPKKLLIRKDASIWDALKQLEATQQQLLICTDAEERLVGMIADGDIRRALIAGHLLTDPVDTCAKKDSVFVSDQVSFHEAMKLISDRIRMLPVVDATHRVVGYYSFKQKRVVEDIRLQNVAVLGLGYVGLTLALCLADSGFKVAGYDINSELIRRLQEKKAPFFEVGLQATLSAHAGRNLQFYGSLDQINADIFILTVGTPVTEKDKKPDISGIIDTIRAVGQHLKAGDTVIMRSTIPVGFSRKRILPELEAASGLKSGIEFYYAFAPERTVEGRALLELKTNPQIVGGFDAKSAEITAQLFNTFTPSVVNMESMEAAELCKLLDNCYRDHMFAFVNQLSPLTERLGIDLCRLVDSANFGYKRNNIPKPSPGVGGPCLTKDPYILATVLEEYNIDPTLIMAARKINETGPLLVAEKIGKLLVAAGKRVDKAIISLVGIAFKGDPETSDIRDSTALRVCELLKAAGATLRVFDPVVPADALTLLGAEIVDLKQAFLEVDALAILNNHNSFSNWNLPVLLDTMNHPAVFLDTWHIFEPIDIKRSRGIIYGGLGND